MAWNNTGCDVTLSKQTSSSILFAHSGAATVRQVEETETMEVRGLTETAGMDKVPSAGSIVDNTVQTTYYAFIDSLVFSITVTTGTKEEWSAARRDESGQWTATKTTIKYSASGLDTDIWGTTPMNESGVRVSLSASGVTRTISTDKTASFCHKVGGSILSTTIQTTVFETRYIDSEASARAIVDANIGVSGYLTVTTKAPDDDISVGHAWYWIPYGTEKFASARYVSPSEGWTVTITHKEYSFIQGQGWYL